MKSRKLLMLVFLGVGAIAIGWVYESRKPPAEDKESMLIPDDIDYYLSNLHYREINADGELEFEFHSPRLEHYPLNDISSIEKPSIQIHGDEPWRVDSLDGEFRHQKEILHLSRQVVMQKQGKLPMQVYGESLVFESRRNRITSDTDILVISAQGKLNAENAVFDLSEKIYRFNRARAVYRHDKS